ncbi:hypothetical protein DPMN_117902 [Dreissena polymorpha]|uniref:Uncharacterized protein n=1 Tax=Dreissena polymorpha TaxID=45954 RepID=A0A9D4GJ30_DREPO|nr:hypothetical protein DPMN_117902 [Dreissena polymorpha]
MDFHDDLKEVLVFDGSHLVFADNFGVDNIYGDGRSMIHVIEQSALKVAQKITTHAHVFAGSSLVLGKENEAVLVGTTFIQGQLLLGLPENQTLTLQDPAKVTIDSTEMTGSTMYGLKVGALSALTITNPNHVFDLNVKEILVNGAFKVSGNMSITNLTKFTVGTTGSVEFNPSSSDLYLGGIIDIRGSVKLGKHVSIVYPCTQFLLEGGTLTWPNTIDVITMECDVITINGVFSPGVISFGEGATQFMVGTAGTFTMTADGPIIADTVGISGKMYVNNLATFKSKTTADDRINTFVINHPNGILQLNTNSLPGRKNGVQIDSTCSTLNVRTLTIDKTFTASNISIGKGIDKISVNLYGSWVFTPCGDYKVDELYCNGTMTSTKPLTLIGYSIDKLRSLHLEYGGKITLDSLAQSSKAWTGVSVIGVHEFKLYGDIMAGKLTNYVGDYAGWDRLDINVNGSFYFLPNGPFIIDYLYVNGYFEAYGKVNMTSIKTLLSVHIDTKGTVKFDSLLSSNWVSESAVTAVSIDMESQSQWISGNTVWDVTTFKVSGRLYCHPYNESKIVYLTVESGGLVEYTRPNTLKGFTCTVESGGTMSMFYQRTPEKTSEGCEATQLLYKTLNVHGTLRAGSLYIGPLGDGKQFCQNITISGSLDVTGGGYLYDKGPGMILMRWKLKLIQTV